jgi:AbrB family looped-hinge helix DNA binding protein
MEYETGRLSSKGQTTIPATIRKALALNEGDDLLFELQEGRVVLRKLEPLDIEYLKSVESSFASEWNSPEDEEAFRDL